jgi:hypothetical protein
MFKRLQTPAQRPQRRRDLKARSIGFEETGFEWPMLIFHLPGILGSDSFSNRNCLQLFTLTCSLQAPRYAVPSPGHSSVCEMFPFVIHRFTAFQNMEGWQVGQAELVWIYGGLGTRSQNGLGES